MQRKALRQGVLLVAIALVSQASSQITTATGFTPAYLVQNVLLGPGVTASNFTFLGDPDQVGTFDCVNCNVGMSSGFIMGSGSIAAAVGPNNSSSTTLGGGNIGVGDVDLSTLIAPSTTNDRAALEFDFVPTGDSIKFNFVFASEEYLEWVGSQFQDAFGFFLSGPGIAGPYSGGAINLAKVPGSIMTPITINTINNVTNSAYYINNGDGFTAPMNVDPYYIQYDGFTVILTAEAQVICGQTYHIKLAIADGSDASYDCAVFIEAGSFASNSISLSTEITSGGIDSVLYEGCGHAVVNVVRAGLAADTAVVTLSTSGVAVEGIDYSSIPGSLVFLPGVDSLTFTVDALVSPNSGMRLAQILAIYAGDCGTDTTIMTFWVDDAPPITTSISNDTTLTCTDSTFVWATATGGYGTLYFDWNTGIPDSTLSGWVSPPATTTYILTVTDDCGVVTEVEDVIITIPIPAPLLVQAVPDTMVFCPESPVQLSIVQSGGQPGYTYLWSGGLGTGTTANVAPPVTQTWSVTVTDLCGNATTDQVTVTVQYDTVQVVISPDTVICAHDTATLTAITTLGWGGYSWLWDNGSDLQVRSVQPGATSTYTVTVTDGCGISATDQTQVGVNDPLADFYWNGSVYVQNFPVQFIDQSVGAVTWSWDFDYPGITSTDQYPVIIWPDSGLFNVMLAITDPLGCVDTTWHTIWINPEYQFYAPNAFSPDGDGNNDVFHGSGVGIDAYHMRIFDRWGQMIYETEELLGTWDGKVGGAEAPQGVYVYWFRLHAISGKVSEHRGHTTLLR